MTTLTVARLATLKANGGKDFLEVDAKWRISRSGDCRIEYNPANDMWEMWTIGVPGGDHSIAGNSSAERINAHWKAYVASN